MSRADKIALLISLISTIAAAWISSNIFEGIPHLEDEFAYVWQAQVIAQGDLAVPTPPEPKSFLVPFVVDHEGLRFGKYPLGWPALLSLGELLGLRWLVNPFLAGAAVWLTYRLGSKLLGETIGVLAAGLTATSPFFLMNSGALLSHPWGLMLSTAFGIAWLDTLDERMNLPRWLPPLTAGLSLGMLALSRPYTALAVAVPFGIQGIISLFRDHTTIRKRVIAVGVIAAFVASLHLLWQYAVTGDPLFNPYLLWWEYDRVGFGPGVGVTSQGHNLNLAWQNLKFSLNAGYSDLFGWFKVSWLFLPFGLWALRKKSKAWPVVSVAPMLMLLYMGYWIGAWVLGPRYYYEGLYSLTIMTAAGIALVAGWSWKGDEGWERLTKRKRLRMSAVTALVAFLVTANIVFYLPIRIGGMQGLFGTSRQQLMPLESPRVQALAPALIIVDTENWRAYAGLLELAKPNLQSPFIFIWDRGPGPNRRVIQAFPDRTPFYYDPEAKVLSKIMAP
jgi:hypothetical protein